MMHKATPASVLDLRLSTPSEANDGSSPSKFSPSTLRLLVLRGTETPSFGIWEQQSGSQIWPKAKGKTAKQPENPQKLRYP